MDVKQVRQSKLMCELVGYQRQTEEQEVKQVVNLNMFRENVRNQQR